MTKPGVNRDDVGTQTEHVAGVNTLKPLGGPKTTAVSVQVQTDKHEVNF